MAQQKRTQKQIEAARRNGAKSKGPVTDEGKARASQNALKHGLHSRVLVLSNESNEKYAELRDEYFRHYAPETRPEIDLVNDIVAARWRLNRILAVETAAIDLEMDRMENRIAEQFSTIDEATRTALAVTEASPALTLLARQERSLRRTIRQATQDLEAIQAARREARTENCENEPGDSQPVQPQSVGRLIPIRTPDLDPRATLTHTDPSENRRQP